MSAEVGPGVASSVFHVNFCSHETIFQAQYTRYQRARKVKVIRCFPHCCPCHVANRYCGMPLQLLTTLAPTPTPRAYASLLKIAPVDHESWALGDMVAPQNDREGDDSDGATWYPGLQEVLDNNVLGSSFNHSLVDGWTYGWKSGRSQSIRDSLHAATGFLFEVVASASGRLAWHLIAKVTSPGFTVATYRNRGGGGPPAAASLPASLSLPAPIRTMASDLGLLSYFLATVEPSNAAAEAALVGHLVRDVSPVAPFDCVARLNDTPVSDEHELAAALLAHLLEPQHVAQLRAFIKTHDACVLAKATLRQAYNDCVLLLYTIANDFLAREFNTTLSLLTLLVRQKHPALELAVQAQVGIEGRFGYRSVVALFREVSLSATSCPLAPPSATESALSGDWVLDPDASSMDLASGAMFSLWEAARWATWLYGCRLDHRGRTLHVTSDWQLYASAPSIFLLDNTPRLLRTFPNGESTMGGTGVVLDGDYVGHVTSAGDIYLECYRYHLLAACSSRLELQLSVRHGNLSCSFKWYCIDGRLDPSLVVATVAERRAVVWASTSAPIVGCGHAAFDRRPVD